VGGFLLDVVGQKMIDIFKGGGIRLLLPDVDLASEKEWTSSLPLLLFTIGVVVFLAFGTLGKHYIDRFAFSEVATGGGNYGSAPPPACNPETDPNCVPLFCDPSKQSCDWPTPCGCITSLPGHGGMNAIDVGTNWEGCKGTDQEIYATCGGKINYMYMGLGDGQKCTDFKSPVCGHGYGNFIDLYCDDGKTSFRYGHILNPGPGISQGATVTKGQVLGYVDNNGNSTGPHLHFEYRAQGGSGVQNISKILPPEMKMGYCWQK
jgi:murein DD-endopeptidase MepM/ murein hydrolase activator NlpD